MKKKNDNQIKKEIANLEKMIGKDGRYGRETIENIKAQIAVLKDRTTERQIEQAWFADETCEEFQDGDNERYHEAMIAFRWMIGEEKESPSEGEL